MRCHSAKTIHNLAILLLAGILVTAFPVRSASAAAQTAVPIPADIASVKVDGVELAIQAAALPPGGFVAPEPGSAVQMATSTNWEPFRELTVLAVPYGEKPGNEALPSAASTGRAGYVAALRSYRQQQGGKVQDAPTAMLFGKPIVGIRSVVQLFIDGQVPKPVLIDEWVAEAGERLWIVRASQEQLPGIPVAQSTAWSAGLTIDSQNVDVASSLGGASAASDLQGSAGPLAAGDLPTPAWWNGDCDYNTYLAGAKTGSYRLGYAYLGMPACGPRPWADGGKDVLVRFFPGAWGVYEWECVELSMRFLYLKYAVSPYQANGSQVVWNYPGTRLIKISNGTLGKAPQPNDVLSYGATSTFGHTAVVTATSVDANGNGTITVIEENSSSTGKSTLGISGWVVAGNAGSVSGWLHDSTGDPPPNVKVQINGIDMGLYNMAAGGHISAQYYVLNGPVRAATTDGSLLYASERVHNATGFVNELLGIATNQLSNDYWFPWYDNLSMQTWILVGNPSATTPAHVHIYIAGQDMNTAGYDIGPGGRITPTFPVLNGPVHIVSDANVFATERVHTAQGFVQETVGVPNKKLANDYWFPWYDNKSMSSWILVGNPSTTSDAHVRVYIGWNLMEAHTISPGGRWTPQFDVLNGPVHVVSDINVFTSERVHNGTGFVQETMGVPNGELSTNYWFPWYDNLSMKTWILVGNPSDTATAHVHIYIGGVDMNSSGYPILPGGRITPQFDVLNGPVHVVSDINVFTSERIHTAQGFVQETMGVPNDQLTTEYWFPWYDDLTMQSWILVGKP